MSTFARLGREYAAQVLAFAIAVADRLFIPAVLIRYLGVAEFSAWSVAIAVGAFVSVLEFGLTRYYTNRLLYLVERGELEEARRVYRVAATLLCALVVFALAAIALAFPLLVDGVGDPQVDRILPAVVVPVALAAAVLQLLALRQALYRAHRHFTAETMIRLAGEAARIGAVVLAASLGAGLLFAAWVWFAATAIFVVVPIGLSTWRRYRAFVELPAMPRRAEAVAAIRVSPGLWLQSLFTTLYASVPVIAIGALTSSPMIITQFVLMRTIANFVRQVQQMFANLFAIELARRAANDDHVGHAQVFAEANRLLGVQAAVASATLLVLGEWLFGLWTGRSEMFDLGLLLLAIAPPLLVPVSMLSIEALSYANRPWPVVRARLAQLALTTILFFTLPIEQVALRMMAALAIGEVVGLGLPLIQAIHRLNPAISRLAIAGLTALVLATAGVSYLILSAAVGVDFIPAPLRDPGALGVAGLLALAGSFCVGMSAGRRSQTIAQLRASIRRGG